MDNMKRELIGFLYALQEKYDLKNSEVSQLALDVIKEKFSNAHWALVPREPTLAMGRALTPWMQPEVDKIKAGETVGPVAFAMAQWMMGSFSDDYRAMLDAAPTFDPAIRSRTEGDGK